MYFQMVSYIIEKGFNIIQFRFSYIHFYPPYLWSKTVRESGGPTRTRRMTDGRSWRDRERGGRYRSGSVVMALISCIRTRAGTGLISSGTGIARPGSGLITRAHSYKYGKTCYKIWVSIHLNLKAPKFAKLKNFEFLDFRKGWTLKILRS